MPNHFRYAGGRWLISRGHGWHVWIAAAALMQPAHLNRTHWWRILL